MKTRELKESEMEPNEMKEIGSLIFDLSRV